MNIQKMFLILAALNLLFPHSVEAQLRQYSNDVVVTEEFKKSAADSKTATASTTTTSTLRNIPTIQDLANATKESNNRGSQVATTLTGLAAVGVAVSCWKPTSVCKWWVAGLVATFIMAKNMSKAKGQSMDAYNAVTVENPDINIQKPQASDPNSTSVNLATQIDGDVDMRRASAAIGRLKQEGWKIDTVKGDIVTPKGEKLNAKVMNSVQSMQQAGVPSSVISGFSSLPQKAAQKVNEQAAKTADAGQGAFDDSVGGGSRSPSSVASADGGLGNYGNSLAAAPQLGINRDPSQVAGMAKDFNGEKIGVAGDSLFNMIDRRYQLHQRNGSFLAP